MNKWFALVALPALTHIPSHLAIAQVASPTSCSAQVLTVKNRYMLLNETGFAIQYKQIGTPDPHEQVRGRNEKD